jgi:hypothetical protein
MVSTSIQSHAGDDSRSKLRALEQSGAIHHTLKVIGHGLVIDCFSKPLDYQIRGLSGLVGENIQEYSGWKSTVRFVQREASDARSAKINIYVMYVMLCMLCYVCYVVYGMFCMLRYATQVMYVCYVMYVLLCMF